MDGIDNSKCYSGRFVINSDYLFINQQFIKGQLLIVDGYIQDIALDHHYGHLGCEVYDFKDSLIIPGLVDLQINGAQDMLLNDDISCKTVEHIYNTCLRYGVTNIMPTLISATEDQIKQAVELFKIYYHDDNRILGLHIEGPYISKIKKGIHNRDHLLSITEEMVDYLVDASQHVTLKLTLAPEVNEKHLIKRLVDNGIRVSIGHSDASFEETMEVINDCGVRLATHLFNAMSPMQSRSPGVVGAILNHDQVHTGIIVDGYHVDFNVLKLAVRLKLDQIFVVSDAMPALGSSKDSFMLDNNIIYSKDGKCVNKDGVLAGANIDMLSSLINLVQYVDVPLTQAILMCSYNPLLAVNKTHQCGKIASNYLANLAILHKDQLTLQGVFSLGHFYRS